MLKKNLKKAARIALSALLTLSMALPGGVIAKAEDSKDHYLDTPFECSSEGKDFCTVSISYNGVIPDGGGAHLYFYDDGVKYEGEDGEALSIYEGAMAYLEANPVPGYEASIEFMEDVKVTDFQGYEPPLYFEKLEKNVETGFFQVPEIANLTVMVSYERESPVALGYFIYGKDTEPLFNLTEVPSGTEIELPASSISENGIGSPKFYGWLYDNKLYQPGEHVLAWSRSGSYSSEYGWHYVNHTDIQGIYLPPISCSQGISYRIGIKWGDPVLEIKTDQTSKQISSLSAKGYSGEETCDIDIRGENAAPYIELDSLVNYERVEIEADFSEEDAKNLVLDLTGGASDELEKNISDSVLGLEEFHPEKFLIDRAGYGTPVKYTALDLNHDGNLDVRYGALENDYYTNEAFYSHYYNPVRKLLRMSGAELCEEDSYSVEANLPSISNITIKLFESYPVTFMDGEDVLFEQKVREGKPVQKPKDPVKEGYTFKGWKLTPDSVSKNAIDGFYDFEKPVTSELTLLAVWEKKEDPKTNKDPETEDKQNSGSNPDKKDDKDTGTNPDKSGDKDPGAQNEPDVVGAPEGTRFTYKNEKAKYTVTKQGTKNSQAEVCYDYPRTKQGKRKVVKVPSVIEKDGVEYKVTTLKKNSLAYEKRAKTIDLGENIETIQAKAFSNCKKLKILKLRNPQKPVKLTKKTFAGIKGHITIFVPKDLFAKYKSMIKKQKLTKKVTLKQL